MKSKISFAKLMKEDVKRRSWMLALTILSVGIAMPVVMLMLASGYHREIELGYYTIEKAQMFYLAKFDFTNMSVSPWYTILTMGLAVIGGITGFAFTHSSVKTDFYHSLPIRREKLFRLQYVTGVVMFALPLLAALVLEMLIGAVYGYFTWAILPEAAKLFGFLMLVYLMFYGMTIVAMMMTGKIIVALLGTGVFATYPLWILGLVTALSESFL